MRSLSKLFLLVSCLFPTLCFAQSQIANKQFSFEVPGSDNEYIITFSNEIDTYSNGNCIGYEQVWSGGCYGNNPSCEEWGCFMNGSYDPNLPDAGVCDFVGGVWKCISCTDVYEDVCIDADDRDAAVGFTPSDPKMERLAEACGVDFDEQQIKEFTMKWR